MINQEMKKIIYKIMHNAQKSDGRRQEKTRHENVVLFPFGMSLRGFLLLCSAIYKAWGMLLLKEKSIYELEFARRSFLGKMILRRSCNSNLFYYTKQKGSFPVGKPPLVCIHII